jgi:hypothetical protein
VRIGSNAIADRATDIRAADHGARHGEQTRATHHTGCAAQTDGCSRDINA